MCFSSLMPKPPKPPPIPSPPSARDEGLMAQQDELRRKAATQMSASGTVMTSPMGDPGVGQQVKLPSLGGQSSTMGTRIG
jgi:hypothetical protein